MSSKEFKDVESAVAGLKVVAENLHTPLDTSELERAVRALKRAVPSDSDSDSKSESKSDKSEKPDVAEQPKAPAGTRQP